LLSLSDFETLILSPAINEFTETPVSFLRAFTAVWTVDAFASHVAWHLNETPQEKLKYRDFQELDAAFKKKVEDSDQNHGWRFRVLRNLSNATKHAIRSPAPINLVKSSGDTSIENREDFLWYFQNSKHWGNQVVVELDVTLEIEQGKEAKYWKDKKGNEYRGLVFKTVPVLDLIDPSLKLIRSFLV